MALSADQLRQALDVIARWRNDPETDYACPCCSSAGLSLADRSARPHAEWYHLSCAACGLDETIHIPLAPPAMDFD